MQRLEQFIESVFQLRLIQGESGRARMHEAVAPEPLIFNREGLGHTMNTKLAATGLVAGALMLPIAGNTADSDSDRASAQDICQGLDHHNQRSRLSSPRKS